MMEAEIGAYYLASRAMASSAKSGWKKYIVGPQNDDVYIGRIDGVGILYCSGSSTPTEWLNNVKGFFNKKHFMPCVEALRDLVKAEGFGGGNCIVVGYSRGAVLGTFLIHKNWVGARGLITIGHPGAFGIDVRQKVWHVDVTGNLDPIDLLNPYSPAEKPHVNKTWRNGHLGYNGVTGPLRKYGKKEMVKEYLKKIKR